MMHRNESIWHTFLEYIQREDVLSWFSADHRYVPHVDYVYVLIYEFSWLYIALYSKSQLEL